MASAFARARVCVCPSVRPPSGITQFLWQVIIKKHTEMALPIAFFVAINLFHLKLRLITRMAKNMHIIVIEKCLVFWKRRFFFPDN